MLSFASCRIIHPSVMFDTKENFEYSEFKPSEKEYKIKPFDKLSIQIFTNDGYRLVDVTSNISRQSQYLIPYLVEYDGTVKVPILGRIQISGFTIREAEKMLEENFSQNYQKPYVILNVTNRRVIVFSDGSSGGKVIPITNENFTLIEALAQSGGISNFSKAYKIKLIRGDLNNPEVFLFNISTLNDMKKTNFFLQANDIIYVETRPRYASKLLFEITPYISILTTILLVFGLIIK